MSEDFRSKVSSLVKPTAAVTPLVVVLGFIVLVEVVVTVGLIGTSGDVQLNLSRFIVLFPCLIALAFFSILVFKPTAFYGPSEYRDADTMRAFHELMTTRRGTVTEAFNRIKVDVERKIDDKINNADGNKNLDVASLKILMGSIIKDSISDNGFNLQIPLADGSLAEEVIIYKDSGQFQYFLDEIYYAVANHRPIQAYTYGIDWILCDASNEKRIFPLERKLLSKGAPSGDSRILSEIGIKSGMTLKVKFLNYD